MELTMSHIFPIFGTLHNSMISVVDVAFDGFPIKFLYRNKKKLQPITLQQFAANLPELVLIPRHPCLAVAVVLLRLIFPSLGNSLHDEALLDKVAIKIFCLSQEGYTLFQF